MAKKTYTATGYMEWVANINVGSASIQVPFTGGAVTKYGTIPAEYTTSDPVIQKIIENSTHFLNRRILLYKVEDEPDKQELTEQEPAECMEHIPVNCLMDAAEILRERFNISIAKIQSKKDARRIGRQHNINFTGL